MSLNKVLNRPLFRKQALKKGALKPITAQTGIMVGSPMGMNTTQATSGFMPPAINEQGFYGRNIRPFFQRARTGIANLPGRIAGDVRSFIANPRQALTSGRPGFGTAATLSAFGTFPIMEEVTRKLGMTGVPKDVVDLLGAYGMTRNPYTLGLGLTYMGYRGARPAVAALVDDVRNLPQGTTAADKNFMPSVKGALGKPFEFRSFEEVVKANPQLSARAEGTVDEAKTKIASGRGAGDVATGIGRDELRAAKKGDDVLTAKDNETQIGNNQFVDLSKVATNASGATPPDAVIAPPPPPAPVTEKITEEVKETVTDDGKKITETEKKVFDQASPFAKQIEQARQIANELKGGRTSNARAVFLTNLASGLLTGTTKRQGLGGALEVLGQALGPAVNNSVMIQMKEDELDQKLLGRALEFSNSFLKAQNEAYALPDTKEVGVIQYINKNGRIVNVAGRMLKDGTKQIQIPGAVNPNGTSVYRTAPAGTTFIANKDMNKETLKAAADLGGKYSALELINRSLGIIERGEAQAGVKGAVGLYTGRISDALGDLAPFLNRSTDEKSGRAAFNAQQLDAAKALVKGGEFDSIQEAQNYLTKELGSFNKNKRKSFNNIKKRLEGGSKLDYERLAINETVLVYRLANSLKSKDRLTQKDIQMAKELVQVFPIFRGEESVVSALIAVGETILDDIKQQENNYLKAGGSTEYLIKERQSYGLLDSDANVNDFNDLGDIFGKRKKGIQGFSREELLNRLRLDRLLEKSRAQ